MREGWYRGAGGTILSRWRCSGLARAGLRAAEAAGAGPGLAVPSRPFPSPLLSRCPAAGPCQSLPGSVPLQCCEKTSGPWFAGTSGPPTPALGCLGRSGSAGGFGSQPSRFLTGICIVPPADVAVRSGARFQGDSCGICGKGEPRARPRERECPAGAALSPPTLWEPASPALLSLFFFFPFLIFFNLIFLMQRDWYFLSSFPLIAQLLGE